jgi:hypothetical protein
MAIQDREIGSKGSNLFADAAIGAFAGAIGVWAMDRLDWFMWRRESPSTRRRTTAVRPEGEPPAHVIATKLEKVSGMHVEGAAEVPGQFEQLDTRGLSGNRHHMIGTAVHYGIGVGPASIYGVIQDRLPLSGPARGALYGVTLFFAQDEGANALTGLSAKPREYPWQDHARGLLAHIAYGIVTEAVVTIVKKQLASSRDEEPRHADRWSEVVTA